MDLAAVNEFATRPAPTSYLEESDALLSLCNCIHRSKKSVDHHSTFLIIERVVTLAVISIANVLL
jgi:hypothetical protein